MVWYGMVWYGKVSVAESVDHLHCLGFLGTACAADIFY